MRRVASVLPMSQHRKRIDAALQLAARLKAEGRHFDANVVQQLCTSSATSIGTNSQLHRDLTAATARLRQMENRK